MDCAYCYMRPRSNQNMRCRDFERIVDELAALRVFLLIISGGEPFTHPEIEDILRIAYSRLPYVMLLTNGSILTSSHLTTIKEIVRARGELTVQVSIDGVDPIVNDTTRGKTPQIIGNISRLQKAGARVIVGTVITRFNADHIIQLMDTLSPIARYFHFMAVQNSRSDAGVETRLGLELRRQNQVWRQIRDFAREKRLFANTPLDYDVYDGCAAGAPCNAAFTHLVIDPSLSVRPCDRLTDVVIGDLRSSTLAEIWNGEAVRPILESPEPVCRL
jgi:MoaA/NifB/PqqE/SkfB family radical SAM enzyme